MNSIKRYTDEASVSIAASSRTPGLAFKFKCSDAATHMLSCMYHHRISALGMVALYEYTNQPRYWVAHDAQGYWLVPVRNNGWSERTPFIGHVTALRRVTYRLDGIDIGIPEDDAST